MRKYNFKFFTNTGRLFISLFLAIFLQSAMSDDELIEIKHFKAAYSEYSHELEKLNSLTKQTVSYNQQAKIILEKAETAYELGRELFNADSENLINLTVNYANAAFEAHDYELASKASLKWASLVKKKYGKTTPELYGAYLNAGNSESKRRNLISAKNYFDRAIEVVEINHGENSLAHGEALLNAGMALTDVGFGRSAFDYMEQALPIFSQKNDIRAALVKLYMAKAELQLKNYTEAIPYLIDTISLTNTERDNQLELVARAFLVNAYEETGQSEEATKHCILIGEQTPWQDDQEAKPLYIKTPVYPLLDARNKKSGWVELEFIITKKGFVKNVQIIGSKGSRSFKKSALDAISSARFAPKFENGSPVDGKRKFRFTFEL